jgi:hypothetical protein
LCVVLGFHDLPMVHLPRARTTSLPAHRCLRSVPCPRSSASPHSLPPPPLYPSLPLLFHSPSPTSSPLAPVATSLFSSLPLPSRPSVTTSLSLSLFISPLPSPFSVSLHVAVLFSPPAFPPDILFLFGLLLEFALILHVHLGAYHTNSSRRTSRPLCSFRQPFLVSKLFPWMLSPSWSSEATGLLPD